MFDWWPRLSKTNPSDLGLNWTNACTSWYGHSFKRLSDTLIFCPTCGAIRKAPNEQ